MSAGVFKNNQRQLFPSLLSQNIMTSCPLYITTRGYYHLNKYIWIPVAYYASLDEDDDVDSCQT